MISSNKNTRSPLKATDANSRSKGLQNLVGGTNGMEKLHNTGKKRLLEKSDHRGIVEVKKLKVERGRSIEGAVIQPAKSGSQIVIKADETDEQDLAQKQQQQHRAKVSPNELLEWQNNWRKILRRESRIFFDINDDTELGKHAKSKLDRKKELLKRGFLSLGAQITQFFDSSVTIVITRRSVDKIDQLQESDILARAKKNYMKVWGYEKSVRFLKNLDVDLDQLEKASPNALATPTLSNLLQNEKLYGPTERDPRTKREDIHYFKYSFVYMYDLWQIWAPIIALEWKPQELTDYKNLPYPALKMGTFGRCPFIGDGACDESSYKRAVKRYLRDKANKNYALRLRQLYQYHAEPSTDDLELMIIPHSCLDSKDCYQKWQYKLTSIRNQTASTTVSPSITNLAAMAMKSNEKQIVEIEAETNEDSKKTEEPQVEIKKLQTTTLSHQQLMGTLARQETEEFPNDLCNVKNSSKIAQEMKASGAHPSNDVATSFGNGLAPTKASVTSKNIKSLNRLVVDRKLSTKPLSTATITPNTGTKEGPVLVRSDDGVKQVIPEQKVVTTTHNTLRNTTTIKKGIAKQSPNTKNPGYCENCRVKYESLELHVKSERHQSFAQNDSNFETIDSLISKLKFQF